MISFLIKYKRLFLLITVGFFLGSLGFVGAGVFMEEYGPNAAIAKIGDVKIKYKDYSTAVNNIERELRKSAEKEYTDEMAKEVRKEILQNMVNEASLALAAKKFGLGVSDLEVAYVIKNSPIFNNNGMFNKKAYVWVVRNQFGMNPGQYEQSLKDQKAAAKFQNMIILSAKVTPKEVEFLSKADKNTAADYKKDKEKFTLAAVQLKAQALMDKFTQQFNSIEDIEVYNDKAGV